MTADYNRRVKISRQRLTTDDENQSKSYLGRLSIDLVRAMIGDETDKSGILRGCTVAAAGGMSVRVAPGYGLVYDALSALPDSFYRVIEVPLAGITVSLDVGGVQGRWDLIEIQPNSTNGSAETMDFWDPTLGAFTTSSAAPLKISSPNVQVFKGTESAAPKLPAGTAGWLPLAWQFVPAGAVALASADILHCRPILRPAGDIFEPRIAIPTTTRTNKITGGGVAILADGANGLLWSAMEGYFSLSSTPLRIDKASTIAVDFGCYDGTGLPIADQLIYFYAVPAPYPEPFGGLTLARRELYIENGNRIIGGYYDGYAGCLVVASPNPPNEDASGNLAGVATFDTHNTFGTWTGPATDRTDWFYVGSAYWDHPIGLCAQDVYGDRVSPARKPGADIQALMPLGVAIDVVVTNAYPGDPPIAYPSHCFDVQMRIGSNFPFPGETRVSFWDETRDPALTGGASASVCRLADNGAMGILNDSQEFFVDPFSSGTTIKIDFADSTAAAPTDIRCEGYRDGILALR